MLLSLPPQSWDAVHVTTPNTFTWVWDQAQVLILVRQASTLLTETHTPPTPSPWLHFFLRFICFMCRGYCQHECQCQYTMYGQYPRRPEEGIGYPELELLLVISCQLGSGNGTKHSELPSHLSNPCFILNLSSYVVLCLLSSCILGSEMPSVPF